MAEMDDLQVLPDIAGKIAEPLSQIDKIYELSEADNDSG